MRTTVTLDPDMEHLMRAAMRERSVSFKEALNEVARSGLYSKGKPHRMFVQKSFRLGAAEEVCWDKALTVADSIEDEKLEIRNP
ncbi:MAG: hypothetical protein JNK87_32270 [Bryobacterales bacterium]|nr:hypothetical protein [Bryobacterales bacterium]